MQPLAVRMLVVLLISGTFAGCATTVAPSSAKSVIQAKFAAVNRHSLEDIVALYAADAELTAPDFCAPRHGRDDVRRTYQALFSASLRHPLTCRSTSRRAIG